MISVLSVNSNCFDWMQLLVQSVRKFTSVPYEIVIIDNDSKDGSVTWLRKQKDIRTHMLNYNIGHGAGLDMGLQLVEYPFCLILDIDAHLMRHHWDFDLIDLLRANPDRRLIAAKGGTTKPIHPCFMFFPTAFFVENRLSFKATKDFDVGRKIYSDILNMGHDVFRVPVGYEKSPNVKFYDGAYGDVYYLNQQPIIYHNWYSARMWGKSQVDSLTKEEYKRGKRVVFSQDLVKRILV